MRGSAGRRVPATPGRGPLPLPPRGRWPRARPGRAGGRQLSHVTCPSSSGQRRPRDRDSQWGRPQASRGSSSSRCRAVAGDAGARPWDRSVTRGRGDRGRGAGPARTLSARPRLPGPPHVPCASAHPEPGSRPRAQRTCGSSEPLAHGGALGGQDWPVHFRTPIQSRWPGSPHGAEPDTEGCDRRRPLQRHRAGRFPVRVRVGSVAGLAVASAPAPSAAARCLAFRALAPSSGTARAAPAGGLATLHRFGGGHPAAPSPPRGRAGRRAPQSHGARPCPPHRCPPPGGRSAPLPPGGRRSWPRLCSPPQRRGSWAEPGGSCRGLKQWPGPASVRLGGGGGPGTPRPAQPGNARGTRHVWNQAQLPGRAHAGLRGRGAPTRPGRPRSDSPPGGCSDLGALSPLRGPSGTSLTAGGWPRPEAAPPAWRELGQS